MDSSIRLSIIFSCCIYLYLNNIAASQSIIKTLPGFNGDLPFKLETGYIGLGENEEMQMFYYFIESEGNPENDPLILSLTGGPGCSAIYALVFEIGPIAFDPSTFGSSLPSLVLNPYSWTKVSNVIFLDQPVGAGFSYATTSEGYRTNDSATTKNIYTFLVKWLMKHPKFMKNSLYIQGESYAGKIVPMVAWEISKANEAGLQPQMSLQGYLVANPATNQNYANDRVPYAHNMGLVSDEYMKLAEENCNGNYANPDKSNIVCGQALQAINECIDDLYIYHILEPDCYDKKYVPKQNQSVSEKNSIDILLPSERPEIDCRTTYYKISESWANNPLVREALHVREGTKGVWVRCNRTLTAYDPDVTNVVDLHRLLSQKGYHGLVYSGDHDMVVPHISTLKWIRSLNFTIDDNWRPWKVNRQIAGYTVRYKENETYLTFVTVKGAGHTPPEYKPEECLNMISRWLSHGPI